MAVFNYERLTTTQTLGNSVTTTAGNLIVNGSSEKSFIRCIMLHNTDTSTRTVNLYYVPGSSSTTPTTYVHKFWNGDISSNASVYIEIPAPGIILEDLNDTIKGMADLVNKVTISIYGGKE